LLVAILSRTKVGKFSCNRRTYKTLPYYKNFLRTETQIIIFYLALSYTIIAFIYYLFTPISKIKKSKGTAIFNLFKRTIKGIYYYVKFFNKKNSFPKIKKQEKTALLFTTVKIFFLPIMLNFFFNNYFSIKDQLPNLTNLGSLFSINTFNFTLFPFLLTLIFLIDTLWFSFGFVVVKNISFFTIAFFCF